MADILPKITEKAFQQSVLDYACLQGWLAFHVLRSKGSQPGYPDANLIRPPRVVYAEFKVGKNRLSIHQAMYRERLLACPGVEYYLWKPSDWEEIEQVLRRTR